jgi:membrane glycosyltransferase
MVSIPLSVYTSRISLGRRARRAGIFSIPEDATPPREIQRMQEFLKNTRALPDFAAAVTDPLVNTLACATGAVHARQAPRLRHERERHAKHALGSGPHTLTSQQKLVLLNDAALLYQLHTQVSSRPAGTPMHVAANPN